jgi:hypothetical protein
MGKILTKYLPYILIIISIGINGVLYWFKVDKWHLAILHIFFLAPLWYLTIKRTFYIGSVYRNILGFVYITFAFAILQYSLAASETTGYFTATHVEKLFITGVVFVLFYLIVFSEKDLRNFEISLLIYIIGLVATFYIQYLIFFKDSDSVNSLFLFSDILLLYITFYCKLARTKLFKKKL